MDRKINEVDDDGLTTPLIANLSLNSDADGDDVPLVQPPVLGLWCVQRESRLLKINRFMCFHLVGNSFVYLLVTI